jgi:uncharacterized membrane-anchored protein YitT (DUF2179 family)
MMMYVNIDADKARANESEVIPAKENSVNIPQLLFKTLLMTLGVVIGAFGVESFLVPNHFVDGGITGVAMLVSDLLNMDLSTLILLLNLPFLVLAWRQISREFALKCILMNIGLAVTLTFVPFPPITEDKVLAAVFGGFFLGAGLGLTLRGGGVLDGADITAIILSRKMSASIGDANLALNIVIFLFVGFLVSFEAAMYSTLTYLVASKTVDFFIYGFDQYKGVWIISQKSDEIRDLLCTKMNRSVTVFHAQRGLTHAAQDVLFCVATHIEVLKIKQIIRNIDWRAFITVNPVSNVSGGKVKKQVIDD